MSTLAHTWDNDPQAQELGLSEFRLSCNERESPQVAQGVNQSKTTCGLLHFPWLFWLWKEAYHGGGA